MIVSLLSLLLLIGAPSEDSVTVSKERFGSLVDRVDDLESRVQRYEEAEQYFESVLSSERTWWSTVLLITISLAGLVSYGKIKSEVKKVTKEISEFRDRFRDTEERIMLNEASLTRSYANESRHHGDWLMSLEHRIDTIRILSELEEKSEKTKIEMRKTIDAAVQDIVNAKSDNMVINKEKREDLIEVLSDSMGNADGDIRRGIIKLASKVQKDVQVTGDG